MTYADWENESTKSLESIYNAMKKHYDYILYKVRLEQLREKEERGTKVKE